MRKRWKRAIAVMMFAAVMVSGCGSNTAKKSSAEEPVHITFGHGQAEGHPYHIAALQFKKEVEKKTDHRVIVDVQPNGNLGDEREMTEGLQLGTIDITVAVAATLSGLTSRICLIQEKKLSRSLTERRDRRYLRDWKSRE